MGKNRDRVVFRSGYWVDTLTGIRLDGEPLTLDKIKEQLEIDSNIEKNGPRLSDECGYIHPLQAQDIINDALEEQRDTNGAFVGLLHEKEFYVKNADVDNFTVGDIYLGDMIMESAHVNYTKIEKIKLWLLRKVKALTSLWN